MELVGEACNVEIHNFFKLIRDGSGMGKGAGRRNVSVRFDEISRTFAVVELTFSDFALWKLWCPFRMLDHTLPKSEWFLWKRSILS